MKRYGYTETITGGHRCQIPATLNAIPTSPAPAMSADNLTRVTGSSGWIIAGVVAVVCVWAWPPTATATRRGMISATNPPATTSGQNMRRLRYRAPRRQLRSLRRLRAPRSGGVGEQSRSQACPSHQASGGPHIGPIPKKILRYFSYSCLKRVVVGKQVPPVRGVADLSIP